MKPKEKTPDLKSSLSKTAAYMADRLYKDVSGGNIVAEDGVSWVESFKALSGWYKIEKGIDDDETEGEGIRGIAAKLGTGKPTRSRGRAAAPTDTESNASTGDGPTTTETLDRIRSLTKHSDERGDIGGAARNSNGAGQQGAAVFIAGRRLHPVGVGHSQSNDDESDGSSDV